MKYEGRIKKLAGTSRHHAHRHATLVLQGGAVIAAGINKGHIHSEVTALRRVLKASNSMRGRLSLINLRLTAAGNIGMSRPCEECWKFLAGVNVRKVTYSAESGWVTESVRRENSAI